MRSRLAVSHSHASRGGKRHQSVRFQAWALAERTAVPAARKGVSVVVHMPAELSLPVSSARPLCHALELLLRDAVARAPRDTVVLVAAHRAVDAIVFEVRDADRTVSGRQRPAHKRARQLGERAGWRLRVSTDSRTGTRAVLATPLGARACDKRDSPCTTCAFWPHDNFVMSE